MARILAADDEPAILELLEMNLSLAGYTCTLAADAREALLLLGTEEHRMNYHDKNRIQPAPQYYCLLFNFY